MTNKRPKPEEIVSKLRQVFSEGPIRIQATHIWLFLLYFIGIYGSGGGT